MLVGNKADSDYVKLVYETSRKRITLAGYRLANFVIDIYGSGLNKYAEAEIES